MTHWSSMKCPGIPEGAVCENVVCSSGRVNRWWWSRLTFQQYLCPLCAWEIIRKRVVIRGQAIPYTGKTCLKDEKFPWVSIHNCFFKVISLRATGFATLLKFLWVHSDKARDVSQLQISFPRLFPPLLASPVSSTALAKAVFLQAAGHQILFYIWR